MANFNLNEVILGGRLTAEPELKQTPTGTMVLSFSIAVNRKAKAKSADGQPAQAIADFINCVAWQQTAEFISRYFHKGSSICIVGHIQTRTWDDQQGNKRYATEVVADEVHFVDSKSEAPGAPAGTPPASAAPAPQAAPPMGAPNFEVIGDGEELPF